jgi:hypothetical protein
MKQAGDIKLLIAQTTSAGWCTTVGGRWENSNVQFFYFYEIIVSLSSKMLIWQAAATHGVSTSILFLQVCSHKYFSLLYNSIRTQHSKHNSMRTLLIHLKITDRGHKAGSRQGRPDLQGNGAANDVSNKKTFHSGLVLCSFICFTILSNGLDIFSLSDIFNV